MNVDLPPVRFPSPFGQPHPIAVAAATDLMRVLDPSPREGKMFGVLVCEGATVLRAFSGMLDGRWLVDGFAPPVFDLAARDAFWLAGEAELIARAAELARLEAAAAPLRAELAALDARHALALTELRARHRERKALRAEGRSLLWKLSSANPPESLGAEGRSLLWQLASNNPSDPSRLDQESRADSAERRRVDRAHVETRGALAGRIAALGLGELEKARAARSRELLLAIHATYRIPNARGATQPLRDLFAREPPGGAGDCAAPKLLAWAYARQSRPIALAEFWWGPPPTTGDRRHATFYPACRGKCGPILPWMLEGIAAEATPVFGGGAIAADEPRVIFEDEWLAIVAKPIGLLSVPGRSGALSDSVLVRVRARWPGATVVHRLDLDTSGLMLVAKDPDTHAKLQRMFAERAIDKRYIAWLDGAPENDAGVVELPLRVDLDDRPRQIVDAVYGKSAITEWTVLVREPSRTRVAFTPRTGRTHQLRVHAAVGLGAPIAGDRLYGRAADRMFLHAAAIAFAHPHTGARIAIEELPAW